jgi:hypothetical protein
VLDAASSACAVVAKRCALRDWQHVCFSYSPKVQQRSGSWQRSARSVCATVPTVDRQARHAIADSTLRAPVLDLERESLVSQLTCSRGTMKQQQPLNEAKIDAYMRGAAWMCISDARDEVMEALRLLENKVQPKGKALPFQLLAVRRYLRIGGKRFEGELVLD